MPNGQIEHKQSTVAIYHVCNLFGIKEQQNTERCHFRIFARNKFNLRWSQSFSISFGSENNEPPSKKYVNVKGRYKQAVQSTTLQQKKSGFFMDFKKIISFISEMWIHFLLSGNHFIVRKHNIRF